MKGMASKLFLPLKSHPLIACFLLLLFTPPIFPMVMFFWPLIVSTALGVLAVISFGRQGEHTTDYMESAACMDNGAFPAQEQKISNVLMVDNQEVTWLEWLHNEDTQTFCAQECEQSVFTVWDGDGCDVSSVSPGEPIVDIYECNTDESRIEDTGIVYTSGSIAEDVTCVSALVSTVENETRAVALAAKADLDGVRIGDIALMTSDEEQAKNNTLSLTAEDESKRIALDMTTEDEKKRSCLGSRGTDDEDVHATKKGTHTLTAEDEMRNALPRTKDGETMQLCCDGRSAAGTRCRNTVGFSANGGEAEDMKRRKDLDSVVKNETDVNTPACADEVEGQTSIDGLSLIGESEDTVNALVLGVGDAHTTALSSLGWMIKDECEMNDCASASTGEAGTTLNALLSTSGPPDLSPPNMTVSVMLEKKDAEGHGKSHIYDQDQEERSLEQMNIQAPQSDVGDDDEEHKSSLCFSFFHNGYLIPTPMNNEVGECGQQADKNISLVRAT